MGAAKKKSGQTAAARKRAAAAQRTNGKGPADPPVAPSPDAPEGAEGGIAVDAQIVVLIKRDPETNGTAVDLVAQGDVRLAELPTLMRHATKRADQLAGTVE